MFTYKIIKHEDTENGTLFAIYETAQADDGEILVMWQSPLNGVFYESMDELVDHMTDLNNFVQQVKNGEQDILDSESVTFVDMEGEDGWCCGGDCGCDEDCDCESGKCEDESCACESWERKSFDDSNKSELETLQSPASEGHPKKDWNKCCGGNCGCK